MRCNYEPMGTNGLFKQIIYGPLGMTENGVKNTGENPLKCPPEHKEKDMTIHWNWAV